MCIISDCEPDVQLPSPRSYRYRILYAGNDLELLERLRETLNDCRIVRVLDGSTALSFIRSIFYSLLLFDHTLMDMTGIELAERTRALAHQKRTKIILIPASGYEADIFETITRSLAAY